MARTGQGYSHASHEVKLSFDRPVINVEGGCEYVGDVDADGETRTIKDLLVGRRSDPHSALSLAHPHTSNLHNGLQTALCDKQDFPARHQRNSPSGAVQLHAHPRIHPSPLQTA